MWGRGELFLELEKMTGDCVENETDQRSARSYHKRITASMCQKSQERERVTARSLHLPKREFSLERSKDGCGTHFLKHENWELWSRTQS